MRSQTSVRYPEKVAHVGLKREDIIWAAGLFEGEGSISITTIASGKMYPRIKIKMTDEDTIKKFASIFGLTHRSVQKDKSWKSHYKDAWYADSSGKRAVAILYMIFPWLGERRKCRVEEVLSLWRGT